MLPSRSGRWGAVHTARYLLIVRSSEFGVWSLKSDQSALSELHLFSALLGLVFAFPLGLFGEVLYDDFLGFDDPRLEGETAEIIVSKRVADFVCVLGFDLKDGAAVLDDDLSDLHEVPEGAVEDVDECVGVDAVPAADGDLDAGEALGGAFVPLFLVPLGLRRYLIDGSRLFVIVEELGHLGVDEAGEELFAVKPGKAGGDDAHHGCDDALVRDAVFDVVHHVEDLFLADLKAGG